MSDVDDAERWKRRIEDSKLPTRVKYALTLACNWLDEYGMDAGVEGGEIDRLIDGVLADLNL